MTVRVEYLGFRNESEVFFLFVHNGQVPCSCILKDFHYFAHRHSVGENSLWRVHELFDGETIVQARLEHNVAHLV